MRRWWLGVVGALAAAALPAIASAALLWTLVAVPLTTTVNVSTTFTLTATNLDATELGCLEVDLASSFVIEALGTPTASNGEAWASSRTGNAVFVHSLSGGGRLHLSQSVQFSIRAHATAAGTYLWPSFGQRPQDCSKTFQAGVSLSVTVLPAIVATPTPTPTPEPTATLRPTGTPAPTASVAPTPTPTPILPLPSIGLPGLPTPTPTLPTGTLTPDPSATATPTPDPTSSSVAVTPGGSSGSGGTAGGQALVVARPIDNREDVAGLSLAGLELLGADYAWIVPSALVGTPGVIIILVVLLQAIGAFAWIPAVRRMANEDAPRLTRSG
jgi:hypothetical protein